MGCSLLVDVEELPRVARRLGLLGLGAALRDSREMEGPILVHENRFTALNQTQIFRYKIECLADAVSVVERFLADLNTAVFGEGVDGCGEGSEIDDGPSPLGRTMKSVSELMGDGYSGSAEIAWLRRPRIALFEENGGASGNLTVECSVRLRR